MKNLFPFTDDDIESDDFNYDNTVLDAIIGVGLAIGAGYFLHKTIGKLLNGTGDNNRSSGTNTNEQRRNSYSGGNKSRNRYSDEMAYLLAVLGLKPGATPEVARLAYWELSKKFHPDVISGKGLDDEFVRFSTKRFQEIQESYDYLKERL